MIRDRPSFPSLRIHHVSEHLTVHTLVALPRLLVPCDSLRAVVFALHLRCCHHRAPKFDPTEIKISQSALVAHSSNTATNLTVNATAEEGRRRHNRSMDVADELTTDILAVFFADSVCFASSLLLPPPRSTQPPSQLLPIRLHFERREQLVSSPPTLTFLPMLLSCLICSSVYLRAFGGEAAGASSLAPKVGPLGLSAKKVADDIAKATMSFKGLRVTVKLTVQNRVATVSGNIAAHRTTHCHTSHDD